MRFRFSLRLLFVTVTLSAIAIYRYVARPTILAERFVAAVRERDYPAASSLLRSDFWLFHAQSKDPDRSIDLVYAEVLPREWLDIWNRQRRVLLRIGSHRAPEGRRVDWTEDTELIAQTNGLRLDLGTYGVRVDAK